MQIDRNEQLEEAIRALRGRVIELDVIMESTVHAFIEKCRAERKELRAAIAREHQLKQKFSQAILTYRVNKGNLQLEWSFISYRPNDKTPHYKRIPISEGGVHLSRLQKGAHPDEVELLKLHEIKARSYRELNRLDRDIVRRLKSLQSRYELRTGFEFPETVFL